MQTLRYPAAFLAVLWTLTLVFAAASHAATERADLESRLPVHQPVFCANSSAEWNALTGEIGLPGWAVVGYTWMEGPQTHQMYFSPGTCRALNNPNGKAFPDAVETLYHEWVHSNFGTRDEGETECLALYIYRYALRHFWGFSPAEAWRDYKKAFSAHTLLGALYPAYRGTCTYPQRDPAR